MTGRRTIAPAILTASGSGRPGNASAAIVALALSLALPACSLLPSPASLPGGSGTAAGTGPAAASLAQPGGVEIRIRVAGASPSGGASSAVRQVSALDNIVAKVKFELTGPNVPSAPAIEVTRSQFTNNRATVRWKDLLPGPVTAKATLFDAADRVLARAQGEAAVEAGKTAQLELAIVPETGSATLSADLEALGEPASGLGVAFAPLAPGSWQVGPPMAIPRAAHAAVALGGQVFAVAGDFNDMLERFDPATWRWTPQFIPNDQAIMRLVGNAAVLRNRIVIVGRDLELGGKIEAAAPVFVDPFAPGFAALEGDIGAFRPVPPFLIDLQAPRTAVGAVSDGNTLYMLGGSSRRTLGRGGAYVFVTLDAVEALSAASGRWSIKASMPTPRGAPGAARIGAKIYVAGGFRWKGKAAKDPDLGHPGVEASGATQEVLATVEAYDPAADSWSSLAPMPTARHGLSLVASNGRLYAIGGSTADGKPLATVESYDPAGDSWRAEPALTMARALSGAVALSDGTILVTGGFGPDRRAQRSTEVFLPEAQP